jgi:hypothetical protein
MSSRSTVEITFVLSIREPQRLSKKGEQIFGDRALPQGIWSRTGAARSKPQDRFDKVVLTLGFAPENPGNL